MKRKFGESEFGVMNQKQCSNKIRIITSTTSAVPLYNECHLAHMCERA